MVKRHKRKRKKQKRKLTGSGSSRDYQQEYLDYYGPYQGEGIPTPLQRLHRKHKTSRGQARKTFLKKLHLKHMPPGYDVDHKNHNPLDNRPENLRVMSAKRNRGKCRLGFCKE